MEPEHAIHGHERETAAIRRWNEVRLDDVWPSVWGAATHAQAVATKDLRLDGVALRFFEPAHDTVLLSPTDVALDILNAPPYNAQMTSRIVPPNLTQDPMVIWVRTGLSPPGVTFVVTYECRYLWQCLRGHVHGWDGDAAEEDAELYALQNTPLERELMSEVWQWYSQSLSDTPM